MDILQLIINHSRTFKPISHNDFDTLHQLLECKTIDEWNIQIAKLEDISLRSKLESNGCIKQIIKEDGK